MFPRPTGFEGAHHGSMCELGPGPWARTSASRTPRSASRFNRSTTSVLRGAMNHSPVVETLNACGSPGACKASVVVRNDVGQRLTRGEVFVGEQCASHVEASARIPRFRGPPSVGSRTELRGRARPDQGEQTLDRRIVARGSSGVCRTRDRASSSHCAATG